ncbi:beta-N-acetylglucosaminidase domain-containing protein [Allokutzneria sp. A3M-2-11 16]|uniref:beta-N-acetylglucosaminidase domain-containing protein n=1 Tax=Allokutzneria sp. A3M-2-11 16 TaxID=2962043 RepID=UPI0020B7FB4A|nr:beta-N-acetylglucosaminidase domain-containing protein [Allokutzneria sp. A3M-2-11 16]MCP3803165.1 beta-N-acetylglucosaminidase domain-containing protein [Allokutzneria sp. A3M-2-11 16]
MRVFCALLLVLGLVSVAPRAAAAPVPELLPAPQSITSDGAALPLPRVVSLIAAPGADPTEVEQVLRAAGVREIRRGGRAPLTVWLGGIGATEELRRIGVAGPEGLATGGYVVASRPGRLVLSGVDGEGGRNAAQTLRGLLAGRGWLPSVTVRDWPAMSWRGVVEGFYGPPWTVEDRLRQIDLAASRKMNVYVYAPKDDPYHRERWREPYPAAKLAELGRVIDRSRARHVDFLFSISPGEDVCHSAPAELTALVSKAQALWDKGTRDFALFFDDITGQLRCAEDRARFGADPAPLAAAQAHLLTEFGKAFPDAARLVTVPTEYTGTAGSVYQRRFGELVPARAQVFWTGPQVVSPKVSTADATKARAVFGRDLLLWDNYPVNDFEPRALFLGPLSGRDGGLPAGGVVGLTANPMPEAEPSGIALATAADYAWNPVGYRPDRSWAIALREIGGKAADALRVFADAAYGSELNPTEAPELTRRIDAFWAEHARGTPGPATKALIERFTAMAAAPDVLRERMGNPGFVRQAEPWLTKLRSYGLTGAAAVAGLAAELRGDVTEAWRHRVAADRAAEAISANPALLATEVIRPFLDRTRQASGLVRLEAAGSTLTATVRAPVAKVEFWAADRLIGHADKAPYRFEWRDAPTARHVLTARAIAANGEAITSVPVRLTVGAPAPALLVVGQPGADAAVADRLERLGHPVVVKQAAATTSADAEGKALVVISSTVASGEVNTKFRDVAVPVLTWEAFVLDDLGMAQDTGETWRTERIGVTDPGSPLAAGLTGEPTVYKGPNRVRWGAPAPTAVRAAHKVGEPHRATIFGYPAGAPMLGMKAPAARVGLFLSDDGLDPDVISADGLKLFDAAVRWLVPP